MYKFVIKRIIMTIPVLIGVAFIIFTILAMTPGDPGRLILGPLAEESAVAQLNQELGYDRPFIVRFINFIGDIVLRLDFGTSYRSGEQVLRELGARLPYTITLALLSMLLGSIIGISLGVFSAIEQYSVFDQISRFLAMIFASIPNFWFGMMLIYIFALVFGLLPSYGVESWRSYILPVVTLSIGPMASLLRLSRTTMLETIRQDYVRTARAKGATKFSVVVKHALKNALLPVITIMGMNFGRLLGGALITETVFSMPGVGMYVVSAIRNKDIPAVMGSTFILAALFSLIMLGVDLLYAYIDPRVKAKYMK